MLGAPLPARSEQLHLQGDRHIADLVEKQRAAFGGLE
jgi:hypothetical protein